MINVIQRVVYKFTEMRMFIISKLILKKKLFFSFAINQNQLDSNNFHLRLEIDNKKIYLAF